MHSAAVLSDIRPDDAPLYFHVHLPRTAGSALQRTWTDHGGWFLPLPLTETSGSPAQIGQELRDALAAGRSILVGGHHPYRLLRPALRPGDVIYAAVREPAERAASLYRYAMSMCQSREIVNYPGDAAVRERWNEDWRANVAARGLDPDAFSLAEFVAAGLCQDDTYRSFFGNGAAAADLGEEMSENGFEVLSGRLAQRLLGQRPVNRTAAGEVELTGEDRQLLESHLRLDMVAYASIMAAFPTRRRFSLARRRRRILAVSSS